MCGIDILTWFFSQGAHEDNYANRRIRNVIALQFVVCLGTLEESGSVCGGGGGGVGVIAFSQTRWY